MSNQSFAAEQLLELLLQLKKTTPEAARHILNSQPQIAYALITLMVTMNAVNFDVFQKTLAAFGSTQAPSVSSPAPPPTLPPTTATMSAVPPHLQPQSQYRTSTPPGTGPSTPTPAPYPYPNGHVPPQNFGRGPPPGTTNFGQPQNTGFGQTPPPSGFPNYPPSYGAPPPQPPPVSNPSIPDALASMPDEQKAMIMRVLSMTPEQINMLGPTERANIIQLRATLGVPH